MPNKSKKNCRKDRPFNYIANQWLERNRLRWKESTYAKYYHIINVVVPNEFDIDMISGITEMTVQQKINNMINRDISILTIKNYLSIINSILEYADKQNYYCEKRLEIELPTKTNRDILFLSLPEQKRLVKVLKNNMDIKKLGILFALNTGIRCGELCALQWKDIDLKSKSFSITKTMQRVQQINGKTKTKVIIMPPKTKKSNRKIPIPQFIVELLKSFYCTDGSAFFLTGCSDKFIEPRSIQNYFKKYLNEAGIQNMNFHSLRHTFATRCLELGFDVKTLSEILGHSNVNITLNLYVHSSFELKIKNMKKLNSLDY